MNKFKRKTKKLNINTLSQVSTMIGLSIFLSGCDANSECNKEQLIHAPKFKVEECKKKENTTLSGSRVYYSGFFTNQNSSYSASS